MKILATYNIKGGVGKTATAVNLAWLAARSGYRTLIWDLDPQGAASFYFRIKPKVKGGADGVIEGRRSLENITKATDYEGLDLVPADFSYRNLDLALQDTKRPVRQLMRLMRPLSEHYDLLFLDTAPSISLVSENVFFAADALLVPLIPTTLSVRTYEQLVRYFRKHGGAPRVLPFFSMADRRKRLHRDLIETLPQQHSEFLKAVIPYASQVELMGDRREPVGAYAANSAAAQAYESLWEEVRQRL